MFATVTDFVLTAPVVESGHVVVPFVDAKTFYGRLAGMQALAAVLSDQRDGRLN